ncbi:MAG: dienelactone hydrolase family protein [Candidatus Zixiibacteriota bacterium]
MKTLLSTICLLCIWAIPVFPAIKTEVVEYKHGDAALEGYLAYDDAVKGPRPGVLVIHQWMGLTDNEKMRATMLAELGYVAFAVDVYGKGIRPKDGDVAGAEAGKYREDPTLFRERLNAGLQTLLKNSNVDAKRVAAIGYCFGGGGALELARSGANIAGVVSFHGSLTTTMPAAAGQVRAKVLVAHGADDPFVPMKDVEGFLDEMRAAGADYQFIAYSGAVHAFTQNEAGNDNSKGAAYNEKADKRSWQAMKDFFAEIFQTK